MATLTRPTTRPQTVSNPFLDSQVPLPFPREQLAQSEEEHLVPDAAESSSAATTVALVSGGGATIYQSLISLPERCHAVYPTRSTLMLDDLEQPPR